jgi:signal transduction histidine kinase
LQQREPHRQVAVDIEPGLHARCDPELITVALEHLLDNAWRHTAATDQARIEFSADRQQDVTVYCLADNGSGFDMAYADKLFEPFQRLHGQKRTLGVGLATVKRVIERHGGKIWARATPGAGAAFYFTLAGQPDAGNGPGVSATN